MATDMGKNFSDSGTTTQNTFLAKQITRTIRDNRTTTGITSPTQSDNRTLQYTARWHPTRRPTTEVWPKLGEDDQALMAEIGHTRGVPDSIRDSKI